MNGNNVLRKSAAGVGLMAALLCASVGNVAFAQSSADQHHAKDDSGMTIDSAMQGMRQRMDGMKMTGDTDKDFVTMMRSHHQSGIDMAKAELANGKDAEAKKMARKIIDAQTKEIAGFDKWLKNHP
ncbi:MAG: DUF305 domain-containing protein [Rhodocyclaceae bacterium]|nr:DUF305 domain-containing protein [Rhodocyclaceae bacterium]